jgi:hypothetical protein
VWGQGVFIWVEGRGTRNITAGRTSPVGSSCFLSNGAGSDETPPSTWGREWERSQLSQARSWEGQAREPPPPAHLCRMRFQRCMLRKMSVEREGSGSEGCVDREARLDGHA